MAKKVIEKVYSKVMNWVPSLGALLARKRAVKMVGESLDCLMVLGTMLAISMVDWLAFWMVVSLEFWMAAG